jgi:thymidylate kinase
VDGAGKTFLINEVESLFINTNVSFARCHLRPKFFARSAQVHSDHEIEKKIVSPEKPNKIKDYFFDYLRLVILTFDYLIGLRFFLLTNYLNKKEFIIFDRYVETLLLEPWRFGLINNNKIWCQLICAMTPKPKLRIYVYGNPKEILDRKSELNYGEIVTLQKSRHKFYTRITDHIHHNTFDKNSVKNFLSIFDLGLK